MTRVLPTIVIQKVLSYGSAGTKKKEEKGRTKNGQVKARNEEVIRKHK